MSIPRSEYPRPQFVREGNWLCLNGEWRFSFDRPVFDKTILVPYAYQTALSGINTSERHDVVYYEKDVELPKEWKNQRILLHFGAVDYTARVYLNGQLAKEHRGGHVGFSVEVPHWSKVLTIRVEAEDVMDDLEMPRGKQYWREEPRGIYYTPTTGIWQSVWMEAVNKTSIDHIQITPDLDKRSIFIDYEISGYVAGLELSVSASIREMEMARVSVCPKRSRGQLAIAIDKSMFLRDNFIATFCWTPENPQLFDLQLELKKDGKVLDEVGSYCGLRKIETKDGKVLLNHYPLYQRLLLDQGYWPQSLLTPPTDEAMVEDIRIMKEMGFNGVRKHQKIEDPRFLYWADKMGFLVWEEMPSVHEFSTLAVERLMDEWVQIIKRDYNHPCIIAWTPLNESWGVESMEEDARQVNLADALVKTTKAMDSTRLVMANDGWEQTITDVLGIHDYASSGKILTERYGKLEKILAYRPSGRALFGPGYGYEGQPIMVTECGGISCNVGSDAWGYTNTNSADELVERYAEVIESLQACELIQGFCYTQTTDVQQEQNGLLTFDHQMKVDPERIRAINIKRK